MAATGASLKRGKSAQDIETPDDLLAALEQRYGPLAIDLACTATNMKAPQGLAHPACNSLDHAWHKFGSTLLWLNPPFDNIAPWVRKCTLEAHQGARIILLCRASIDANWWWDWVQGWAHIVALTPRVKFVGAAAGYPAPLVLATYNIDKAGTLERWKWK